MKKVIIGGIIAMILFYITCQVSTTFLSFLYPGDKHIMSYHSYTYNGLAILAGIMISCTLYITKKKGD